MRYFTRYKTPLDSGPPGQQDLIFHSSSLCAEGADEVGCDVVVSYGSKMAVLSSAYSYVSTLTPQIHSITPRRGGTGGGTRITIHASGLG